MSLSDVETRPDLRLDWETFLSRLSNDVTWDKDLASQGVVIADLLTAMYQNKDDVIARFEHIITDERLFNQYSIHMEYPRPVMDKFVLYMDPEDRFRVRLHKFKSRRENRGVAATIHDHRWHFFSIILAGEYREEVYRIASVKETEDRATIEMVQENRFGPGSLNIAGPLIPHLTVNESDDEHCFSLFVRGPSLYPYSRIFDKRRHTFKRSYGLKKELLVELETLKAACG